MLHTQTGECSCLFLGGTVLYVCTVVEHVDCEEYTVLGRLHHQTPTTARVAQSGLAQVSHGAMSFLSLGWIVVCTFKKTVIQYCLVWCLVSFEGEKRDLDMDMNQW